MKRYLTSLGAKRYVNKLFRPRVREEGETHYCYQPDFFGDLRVDSKEISPEDFVLVSEDMSNNNWHRFYQEEVRNRMRIIELLKKRIS